MIRVFTIMFLLALLALTSRASVNVTNYGCWPDYVTLTNISCTSNSAGITCASATWTSHDVGKALQISQGGALTFNGATAWSNQTLITTIASYSSPTAVTLADKAQHTAVLSGGYGTWAVPGISNAIAAAAYPTDVLLFPQGTYLMFPWQAFTANGYPGGFGHKVGVTIGRGGLSFVGQGPTTNVICQEAGWVTAGSEGERGGMFGFDCKAVGNVSYGIMFSNMTFYGGETVGNTHNAQSIQPSHPYDGQGWDEGNHAISFFGDNTSHTGVYPTNCIVANCVMHGWRGEMIITTTTVSPLTGGNNPYLVCSNCVFYDGNATVWNQYFSHDYNYDVVSNVLEAEEWIGQYQSPNDPPSWFRNSTIDTAVNGFAQQYSYGAPEYYFSNNIITNISVSALICNFFPNWTFVSNHVHAQTALGIGAFGGLFDGSLSQCACSNIVILGNTFTASSSGGSAIALESGGTDWAQHIVFASNSITGGYWSMAVQWNGAIATNVVCAYNTCDAAGYSQVGCSGQYFLDQTNTYTPHGFGDNGGGAANFSYVYGGYQQINNYWGGVSWVFVIPNSDAAQIPAGATITLTNANGNYSSLPIYLNTSDSVPIGIGSGASITFPWDSTAGQWQTSLSGSSPASSGTWPGPAYLTR